MLKRLTSNLSKSIAKLIDKNVDLLDVNEFRVVKSKERSIKTKNKKGTITRTKKAKAKSIKRDFFDFEHVDAIIKVSRDGKRTIERDEKDSRNKAIKNK